MLNKNIKITVDIFMLIAVILSYLRFDGNPTLHIIAGIVYFLLFGIHFYLNGKAFKAYSKSVKRLNAQTKLRYVTDVLLLSVWSVAVISGVLALCSYVGIIKAAFNCRRFHGIFARVGGFLIVIHIVQHGRQIISYFKKKKDNRKA